MLARSSCVSSDFIARSGLPTSPMNKVSPLNMLNGFLVLSNNKYVVDSNVCPGVCKTFIVSSPTLNSSLSFAM